MNREMSLGFRPIEWREVYRFKIDDRVYIIWVNRSNEYEVNYFWCR